VTVKCKIQLAEIIILTEATVVKTTEPGGLKVGPRPDWPNGRNALGQTWQLWGESAT